MGSRRASAGLAWLVLLCLLLTACAAAQPARPRSSGPAPCLPSFPDRDGWYGGDGAYSIRLDARRHLWLFGDTFVSDQPGRRDRAGMQVVLGTTLAISTCAEDGAFQIRYFLKRQKGQYVSSFGDREWLWPQDPFLVDGVLYVPLVSVTADPAIEGPFKFAIAGHRLARIKDFSGADPHRWQVEYLDLSSGIVGGIKAFATTSVVHGGHVYFYPLYSATAAAPGVLGNILARIPVEQLDKPAGAIEYLTREGHWRKRVDPATVKVVLDAAVSEMSVRYHADTDQWIAVYLSLHNRGDRMLYRTAAAPEGPWSEPRALIGSIAEVDVRSPRYDRNNFCYAGKEHVAFARGKKLVVTYICNSFEDFEKDNSFIRRNLFLYRPVVENPSY